jgi:hypothetical protein
MKLGSIHVQSDQCPYLSQHPQALGFVRKTSIRDDTKAMGVLQYLIGFAIGVKTKVPTTQPECDSKESCFSESK